jgi:hypothetical protein
LLTSFSCFESEKNGNDPDDAKRHHSIDFGEGWNRRNTTPLAGLKLLPRNQKRNSILQKLSQPAASTRDRHFQ